jgi:hypothetical protein
LVLFECGRFEAACERDGMAGLDDLTVSFIKHIALSILTHNSFYASVGIGRVLFDFETSEIQELYMLVAENRAKVDDACRRVKAGFIRTLSARFSPMLRTVDAGRGEKQFVRRKVDAADFRLSRQCLTRFAPWGVSHPLPEGCTADQAARLLSATNATPDDNSLELQRIHVFMDPECYSRLLGLLGLESNLEERLMLPKFDGKSKTRGPHAGGRDRNSIPRLPGSAVEQAHALARKEAALRRSAAGGPLRVRVDGTELPAVSLTGPGPFKVRVPADAAFVELVGSAGGKPVVCATFILCGGAEDEATEDRTLELSLPDGSRGIVLEAIDSLLLRPALSEMADRLRQWRAVLQTSPASIVPDLGSVWELGLAAELRGPAEAPDRYDVLLTPDRPAARVDLPRRGRILAGVESWPPVRPGPLVLLVAVPSGESVVLAASPDSDIGLAVAEFPDLEAGTYWLAMEPSTADDDSP